jgi:hypothetical protein
MTSRRKAALLFRGTRITRPLKLAQLPLTPIAMRDRIERPEAPSN